MLVLLLLPGCGSASGPAVAAPAAGGASAAGTTSPAPAPASDDPGEVSTTHPEAEDLPPEPTGADRDALLAALGAVEASLVGSDDLDEHAVWAARNQCKSIGGSASDLVRTAQLRFSYLGNEVTEEQGEEITGLLAGSRWCEVA